MTLSSLIIGTRGSNLALAQTNMVVDALTRAFPSCACSPRIIKTSGDWKPEDGEKRLSEVQGGKGLFVKEIEQAIISGVVQIGVHSMKDVPSFLPDGLAVDHVLDRADPRDVFITRTGDDLMTLPSGSVIGSASMRRQAIIKKLRPDLVVVPLRGNVPTRLDKVKTGQVDATVLAYAGLTRLGLMDTDGLKFTTMDPSIMLPACGQGVIAIESRLADTDVRVMLNEIHARDTGLCVLAERTVLQILDGSCQTPIGAYATLDQKVMTLTAMIASPDGTASYQSERMGSVAGSEDVVAMATDLAHELRANAPDGVLGMLCNTGT